MNTNTNNFFIITKEVVLTLCTTLLLSFSFFTIADILLPFPEYNQIVTANEKKDPILHESQINTWKEKRALQKTPRFYLSVFSGLLFLLIGLFLQFNPLFLSLSLLLTGTFLLFIQDGGSQYARLFLLLLGLAIICFIGIRSHKKYGE